MTEHHYRLTERIGMIYGAQKITDEQRKEIDEMITKEMEVLDRRVEALGVVYGD